jgi:hypothetical protein
MNVVWIHGDWEFYTSLVQYPRTANIFERRICAGMVNPGQREFTHLTRALRHARKFVQLKWVEHPNDRLLSFFL